MVTHFAPIRFYKQTTLRAETFAKSSFYAQILLHREVCHRETFARRRFYTQNLLHREAFAQNSFYTKKRLHRKTLTQKNLSTQTAQRSFYTPNLLHAQPLPRAAFAHRNFSAQKPLRTKVFMHSSFYTNAFIHKCLCTEKLVHTEACAHSTLLHTASFYTERLCFPFLTTYLSCSPFFWLVSGYMGLYENGVPDNPMVYHHFPPLKLICHMYSYIIYIHIPGDGDIPLSPNACWLDMPISSRKSSINLHFIWLIQKKTIA